MKNGFWIFLTILPMTSFAFDGFEGEFSGLYGSVGSKQGLATAKSVFSTIRIEKSKSSRSHLVTEVSKWGAGKCNAWANEATTIEHLAHGLLVAHKKVEFDWCDGKGTQNDTQEGFGYCAGDACHIAYPKSTANPDYFSEDSYRLTRDGLETFGMSSQMSKQQFTRYHGLKKKK